MQQYLWALRGGVGVRGLRWALEVPYPVGEESWVTQAVPCNLAPALPMLHLCCKGTPLACVRPGVHQDPQPLTAKLLSRYLFCLQRIFADEELNFPRKTLTTELRNATSSGYYNIIVNLVASTLGVTASSMASQYYS